MESEIINNLVAWIIIFSIYWRLPVADTDRLAHLTFYEVDIIRSKFLY